MRGLRIYPNGSRSRGDDDEVSEDSAICHRATNEGDRKLVRWRKAELSVPAQGILPDTLAIRELGTVHGPDWGDHRL